MLTLCDVNKTLAGSSVLNGLELSLKRGSRTALTGVSGAGKTTLLRLIAGLDKPDSGLISWRDRVFYDAQHWVPPWQRRVGMVFQDLALWPHLSVAGHLDFVLGGCGFRGRVRKQRRASLLDELQLGDFAGRYPAELSGGQQQRLALARALASQPEILLLDEAFNQLDLALARQLWATLLQLQEQEGWLLIFVTHDLATCRDVADSVYRLEAGKITALSAEQLTQQAALHAL